MVHWVYQHESLGYNFVVGILLHWRSVLTMTIPVCVWFVNTDLGHLVLLLLLLIYFRWHWLNLCTLNQSISDHSCMEEKILLYNDVILMGCFHSHVFAIWEWYVEMLTKVVKQNIYTGCFVSFCSSWVAEHNYGPDETEESDGYFKASLGIILWSPLLSTASGVPCT